MLDYIPRWKLGGQQRWNLPRGSKRRAACPGGAGLESGKQGMDQLAAVYGRAGRARLVRRRHPEDSGRQRAAGGPRRPAGGLSRSKPGLTGVSQTVRMRCIVQWGCAGAQPVLWDHYSYGC